MSGVGMRGMLMVTQWGGVAATLALPSSLLLVLRRSLKLQYNDKTLRFCSLQS